MKYFSTFSGIGYGMMEVWIKRSTKENTLKPTDCVMVTGYERWRVSDGITKLMNKKLLRLQKTKKDDKNYDSRLLSIMVVFASVVGSPR